MCKYIYENTGSNRGGKTCIYPHLYSQHSDDFNDELLIDKEGYCIFHSKDNKWKIENDFEGGIRELITIVSGININIDLRERDYYFSGFHFPDYDSFIFEDLKIYGSINLSFATFDSPMVFSNLEVTSLNFLNSTFNENLRFQNVTFKNSLYSYNAIFENGLTFKGCNIQRNLLFNSCIFNNSKSSQTSEIRIKECKEIHYLSFSSSTIKSRVFVRESSIEMELNFDNCIIEEEFLFEQNQINGTISFKETEFNLKEGNLMNSTVHFENILLNKKGRIIFRGRFPQDEMVTSDLTIHFKNKPEGLILFENFNLNKLYPSFKAKIPDLEKDGIVKIGDGCRKYYCETEIFTIDATKATQNLILDIVKVFCNYFELYANSNLGIEIIERSRTLIRYFYFTDDKITKDEFLRKINDTEYNLWETFSNLSSYSTHSVNDVEKKNLFIEIGALFMKLSNYVQSGIANSKDIQKIIDAISAKAKTHIDSTNGLTINIYQGDSVIETNELLEVIVNITKSTTITPIINRIMKIEQHIHGDGNKVINAENFHEGNTRITIEQVVNADNFFEGNKQVSTEEKSRIEKELNDIKNEPSKEEKESKLEKFTKKWAGTISEVAMKIVKGTIMP